MTAHRLAALADVAPGTAARFDVGRHRICVVRIGDEFFAVCDVCTHQNISLSEGEVHCDTAEIECWKHGSAFSLRTGEPSSLPATKSVPRYDVSVRDGDLFVEIA